MKAALRQSDRLSTSLEPIKDVLSVSELLLTPEMTIPTYQRPYKWTSKNVSQLFGDIALHRDKRPYRLGTVVLHRDSEGLNIVDGQQRTVTLILAVRALIALRAAGLKSQDLANQLAKLRGSMMNPRFSSPVSQAHIGTNYQEICRIVERADFTEELIDFLLNGCEVVVFELADLSEAFQFFDSQNARGRDLDPHDLLKAYHLREFPQADEKLKVAAVARWEDTSSGRLATLFANYLYRIRSWSKGRSARYFSKDDVDLFKGVNLDAGRRYPYAEQLRLVHLLVNTHNELLDSPEDKRAMEFPFRLDQVIINGRRFFELTTHYQDRVWAVFGDVAIMRQMAADKQLGDFACRIIETIDTYPGRGRTGDGYARTIFDCLLICYIDKFGLVEISRAVEKIFIWSYSLRLKMEKVQLASMDKHVLDHDLFRLLNDATLPADFINHEAPLLERNESTKTDPVYKLFKDMRYCA
jgi:hypothetical protein